MPNQRIIAVWGSPHSGKTVFATKFAECLYRESRGTVIVLYTDILTPSLSVLFPNRKSSELYSVGTVLSKTDIYANDVVSNLVTVKERMNLGYLGYRNGENRFSFPNYSDAKVENLLTVLCELADYVVVDCMSNYENSILSATAMKQAGTMLKICTPDLACMSFYQSQIPVLMSQGIIPERQLGVMNIVDADFGMLSGDVSGYLGRMITTVPYSPVLKEQYLEGTLTMPTKDRKYMQALLSVVKAVRA